MKERTSDINEFYADSSLEIEAGNQHVVKKSWQFYRLPIIILCFLLLNLTWEILRTYMSLKVWPWKFTALGVNTAASLSGVFASLILAREQFARTVVPNLSWATNFLKIHSLDEPAWVAYLLNVGPGTATVFSVKYSIKVKKDDLLIIKKNISAFEMKQVLTQLGWSNGEEYHLRVVTKGVPLPPVKKPDEGVEFFAIKKEVLPLIIKLNFHIVITDTLGDLHSKSLPFMGTLPPNYKNIRLINDKII